MDSAQIIIFVFVTKQIDKMCKSSIFFEQQVQTAKKMLKWSVIMAVKGADGAVLCQTQTPEGQKSSLKMYIETYKKQLSTDNRRNAIKIQIQVRLRGNLLMKLHQQRQKDRRSLYRLVTMVVIDVRYQISLEYFIENPDEDLKRMLTKVSESPPETQRYKKGDQY